MLLLELLLLQHTVAPSGVHTAPHGAYQPMHSTLTASSEMRSRPDWYRSVKGGARADESLYGARWMGNHARVSELVRGKLHPDHASERTAWATSTMLGTVMLEPISGFTSPEREPAGQDQELAADDDDGEFVEIALEKAAAKEQAAAQAKRRCSIFSADGRAVSEERLDAQATTANDKLKRAKEKSKASAEKALLKAELAAERKKAEELQQQKNKLHALTKFAAGRAGSVPRGADARQQQEGEQRNCCRRRTRR